MLLIIRTQANGHVHARLLFLAGNVVIYGDVRKMNKKEKIMKEKKNWYKYHIPGQNALTARVKKNAIFISAANSHEHEEAKFDKCYELACKGHNFITEAEVSINGTKYRRDVVDITDGWIYEIETDPKRAKRFEKDPQSDNIIVVELWRKK